MLRSINKLKGYRLDASDGEIGHVKEFYFDDHSWKVRYLIADTGDWLSGRKVLISPQALGAINDHDKILQVKLSREQVEKSPSIEQDKPVSRQFEQEYANYFGWPSYWLDPLAWNAVPMALPANLIPKIPEQPKGDPHLRDTKEVTGYHLQASDGEIGHVEDFILDDEDWSIRYLVVDTRNWWPGKKVLLSPRWIKKVSWGESRVFVNTPRETIKQAPDYDPDKTIMRDYETQLFKAHDKPDYWS
ncbi:MAG: PRC-barrel domain-containing protein [Verrucomicrobiota bacterium]|nr:PRC-barrel domain-containing protein [Verrucomicrobiota bacterium]